MGVAVIIEDCISFLWQATMGPCGEDTVNCRWAAILQAFAESNKSEALAELRRKEKNAKNRLRYYRVEYHKSKVAAQMLAAGSPGSGNGAVGNKR